MDRAPSYIEYLEARGYRMSMPPLAWIRRMFGEVWLQPGFHEFWRVWSPLVGFALCRLYLVLGGRRHRAPALIGTFLVSGFFFHDVPLMLLLGKPLLVCTGAWLFFALATLASARLVPAGWPPA